jgi:hypothetical protein
VPALLSCETALLLKARFNGRPLETPSAVGPPRLPGVATRAWRASYTPRSGRAFWRGSFHAPLPRGAVAVPPTCVAVVGRVACLSCRPRTSVGTYHADQPLHEHINFMNTRMDESTHALRKNIHSKTSTSIQKGYSVHTSTSSCILYLYTTSTTH